MSFRILPVTCALVTLCCIVWLAEAYPQTQIHQQMSVDDLMNVFQVNSHSSVPDYQVVHARSLSKRHATESRSGGGGAGDTKEVYLSAFGRDFRLRLQRNDHLSKSADRLKVFTAEMHADGNLNLTEVTFPDNSSEIGEVYQDDASGAAVLLHHAPDGTILLDGTIGSNLAIKPAPLSLRRGELRQHRVTHGPDDEMFLDNELPPKSGTNKPEVDDARGDDTVGGEWSSDQQLPLPPAPTPPFSGVDSATKGMHIVYHRKPEESSTFSDYMFMEPDRMPIPAVSQQDDAKNGTTRTMSRAKRRKRREQRSPRETPSAVWPEILVIVDYDTYNMHGGNNMDIKRYFISFWNGVDLRYKLLGGPKVRISLAGIIISKGRDATPYLENNRVGGNAVDSAGALTELGKYLYRERRLPTYDVAVVVTKLDLCRREFTVGSCNKGTAGFAYVGGACVVNKRLEKVNSVAIIEDTGGFSGIIVAAHEVGHLLGAVHDGSPPPSYLGGPGAEHCRWEDGYIMSDLRHTERGFKWSICSIQQFKHFLNGDTAKCLYNIPHEDDELPRLLPGKLLSLDAQCRKDRGTSACFKDDRVCAQLFCFDSRSGYCVSYRPAAEGSPCGDGQYCINGRCITENENVIPDFSRVSEVAVPKPSNIVHSVSSVLGEDEGVGNDEEVELRGGNKAYPDLARIVAVPKRTAVLDNEEDISVVDRNGKLSQGDAIDAPPPHTVRKTAVLDEADDESAGDSRLIDSNAGGRPMVQFDNRADHDVATVSGKLRKNRRRIVDAAGPGEGSLAYTSKRPSRNNNDDDDESEVPHMRRTSHLDEVDELSFSDDITTDITTTSTIPPPPPPPQSASNDVTKVTRQQSVDNGDEEKHEDEYTGCDDVMSKLAGGLSCKQFLRRFGDRYCNHHYIMTNCCSSRKTVCHQA